ncbi:hypothetical protein HDU98_003467 [Podochytrium sp. JEL0797]|nr:hypothetical protein HDU98_003467 [Podochytrium sp. JEL0797]
MQLFQAAVLFLMSIQMAHSLPVSLHSSKDLVVLHARGGASPGLPNQNLPGTDQNSTNSPPLGAYLCQGQTLLQLNQLNSTSVAVWNTLETCGDTVPLCLVVLVAKPMFIGCTTQTQADSLVKSAVIHTKKYEKMSAKEKAKLAAKQYAAYKNAESSALSQAQNLMEDPVE